MNDLGPTLAALNACLNGSAAVALVLGRRSIVSGGPAAKPTHARFMLGAVLLSTLFLTSYLTRVYLTGTHRFPGDGALRLFYFVLLGTHTLAAMAVPPLVGAALWQVHRGDFARHRRIARVTFPVWLYVSVTGVAVYVMLYQVPRWLGLEGPTP